MGRVLPLKHTARLVCVLHTLNSSHLLPWLQQQDGEEGVLEFLLQMYPHRVTGEMVRGLAPQHLRNLKLAKCTKLMPQDLLQILERCRHLQQLSLKDCGQLEMEEVVSLCAPHLWHLASLDLNSCISLNDQSLQTILKEATSLRHLSVANTNITDAAFLIDTGKQLSLEMLSQKSFQGLDVKHICALVSVDVSSCSQLSSTGVRHLCSLTGPTLQSLNISWTGVDLLALLYLSGLSLPAAVQFMLDAKVSFGADAGLTSSLWQELSNFHFICCNLKVVETEAEAGRNCLCAFEKSEQHNGESEGSRITEGHKGHEGQVTSGGHMIREGHAISEEHITPEGEVIADGQVIFEKTVTSGVHVISERQAMCKGYTNSDRQFAPEGQVRSGEQFVTSSALGAADFPVCSCCRLTNMLKSRDQQCVDDELVDGRLHSAALDCTLSCRASQNDLKGSFRIATVAGVYNRMREGSREKSDSENDTTITAEPSVQTVFSRLSHKEPCPSSVLPVQGYHMDCTGQSDSISSVLADTTEHNHEQLCSSVHIKKCVLCTSGENSYSFSVPWDSQKPIPMISSDSDNQLLNEGRRRRENAHELSEVSLFPSDDVSPSWLLVDMEEKPVNMAVGVDARSSKIELHNGLSQFSIAFNDSFLLTKKSLENEDAREGPFLKCSSSYHPCVSDGDTVPASASGQTEFELATRLRRKTPFGTVVLANTLSKDQKADDKTEKRNKETLEEDCSDETERRLGDAKHPAPVKGDISKGKELSLATATDAAMAEMFSARRSTDGGKSDGLSTVTEMKNMTRSGLMGAAFVKTVMYARHEVTDLTDLKPMFVPQLRHLCLDSRCFEGHGNISLGVACLDWCLSANSAMSSLVLLCVENSPDMNTVIEVVMHRLPYLKELTVDAAETLANHSVFQLVNTCKNLRKVDLTGACFLTDAALLPLTTNTHLEELLLSETGISRPFLLTIGSIAEHLRVLDLAWCENIEEDSLNSALRQCTELTRLNLRQCPVSDRTVEIMAAHCMRLTSLGLSCVTDISDAAVITLAGCLEHLQSVDLSWNSDLTDASVSALLSLCHCLQTADLTGLKRITSAPFLSIIADLDQWRKCQALIRYKLLVQKATAPAANFDSSDEEPEDLFVPQRSTSYAICLRSLFLHYCDCVCDRHLQEVVAVCQGSLAIVDYYGELVEPVLFSAHASQVFLSPP